MFLRADEWLNWEVHCARFLYPDRPAVTLGPGHTLNIREVRGISPRHLLHCHKRKVGAFVAAARKLRRVHQIQCSIYKAAWSHGDLHLDDILYVAANTIHSPRTHKAVATNPMGKNDCPTCWKSGLTASLIFAKNAFRYDPMPVV